MACVVTFSSSMPHSVLCNKDYIKVYEGKDEGGVLRSRVCDTYEGYLSIISGASNMLVRFHSDSTNHFGGFHASFKVSGKSAHAGKVLI